MKTLIRILSFLALATTCGALTPIVEPIADTFGRFEKSYPSLCDDLLKDIRGRLPERKSQKIEEGLEHLRLYLENIRSGVQTTRRAFADPAARIALPEALSMLVTDIVGFRRSMDALLIEASASKSLVVTDDLLMKLRIFWEEEYSYSWRFASEVAPRAESKRPNQTVEPTAPSGRGSP